MKKKDMKALVAVIMALVYIVIALVQGLVTLINAIVTYFAERSEKKKAKKELIESNDIKKLSDNVQRDRRSYQRLSQSNHHSYADYESDDLNYLEDLGIEVSVSVDGVELDDMPKIQTPDACWVPPNHELTVQGYTILDGMVYLGQGLRCRSREWAFEPALINPELPINNTMLGQIGRELDYWPKYHELSPFERATYLHWLSSGKSDPNIDIGYVFLYFYGIERRLLGDPAYAWEQAYLVSEVQRLQSIYGKYHNFNRYATQLLEILNVLSTSARRYAKSPQPFRGNKAYSLGDHLGLAQLVHDGLPIPAEWALAWAQLAENCSFRTPATRLPELFVQLFKHHYQRAYRKGLKVKRNKTPLQLVYNGAGESMMGFVLELKEDLPDPLALKRQPEQIQRIIDQCLDELDPLSRWVGRNPDKEDSPKVLALIPEAIFAEADHPALNTWRKILKPVLSPVIFAIQDITDAWAFRDSAKPTRKETLEFVEFLRRLGFAMEPDPRFFGPNLGKSSVVVIFPITRGITDFVSEHYRNATVMLHLAAQVAWANDEVSEQEKYLLRTRFHEYESLSENEQARLLAHLEWLIHEKPTMVGLKARLATMAQDARQDVGDFLEQMAQADDSLDKAEIKVLRQCFRLLILDRDAGKVSVTPEKSMVQKQKNPVPITPVPADVAQIEDDPLASLIDDGEEVQNTQTLKQDSGTFSEWEIDFLEEEDPSPEPVHTQAATDQDAAMETLDDDDFIEIENYRESGDAETVKEEADLLVLTDTMALDATVTDEPVVQQKITASEEARQERIRYHLERMAAPKQQNPVDESKGVTSKPQHQTSSCWVPPNTAVKVRGYRIEGGMLYVGESMKRSTGDYFIDGALIRPSLPIQSNFVNRNDIELNYWPSYSNISASARNVYLNWLASGKDDPEIDIGFVFLYFYGLERRLMIDRPDDWERNMILDEVKRLTKIYTSSRSFMGYATGLLDAVALEHAPERVYREPFAFSLESIRASDRMRLGLAQLVKDEQAIPADWALAWAWMSGECNFRTPARRLPKQFSGLFSLYYEQKFGEGLKVKPNKKRLRFTYSAASLSVREVDLSLHEDYPDPLALKRQPRQLREIIEVCQQDLEPLSRWLGRNPGQEESVQALAMLPDAIFPEANHPTLELWYDWLKSVTAPTAFASNELIERWPFSISSQPKPKETTELILFLARLGYGMEPDPRFNGPKALKPGSDVVLFELADEPIEVMTEAYATSALMLHLAVMVAWADGQVTEDETAFLQQIIDHDQQLEASEQNRLKAHLVWLTQTRPKMAGLKKRIYRLSQGSKTMIGDAMVQLASADGYVAPKEIKLLEKLFKELDLDTAQVIDKVHQASTTAKDRVRSDGARPKASKGFQLDQATLEIKRLESQNVSKLLGDIFEEPEEEVVTEPVISTAAEDNAEIEGLDAAHTALLDWLGKAEMRDREAVEAFCESLGIFPDGALEQINDIAFERCDAPLIQEEGDQLEIDSDIYEELTA